VTDTKTRYMIAYSAAAAGFTGMITSALINPSFTGIAFGAATGAGALYGLLLSVVQVSNLIIVQYLVFSDDSHLAVTTT
jgi:hypothetical protein